MVISIKQVIGCAYTYRMSQVVRNKFSEKRKDHSSHKKNQAFSYFKKVEKCSDIVKNHEPLILRQHPFSKTHVAHWYEPELALLLGEKHEIIGYSLANDLTAATIEFEPSRLNYDPTYCGIKLE